jgi:hypothetical protein
MGGFVSWRQCEDELIRLQGEFKRQ